MDGWKLQRDGHFVRLELPPPERWVIAMTPATAMELAHELSLRRVETRKVQGIVYRLKWSAVEAQEWCLWFDNWPGKLLMSDEELSRFCFCMRRASQETNRSEYSIMSPGDVSQFGM